MPITKRVKYPIVQSIKVHENDMATAVVHLPCDNATMRLETTTTRKL